MKKSKTPAPPETPPAALTEIIAAARRYALLHTALSNALGARQQAIDEAAKPHQESVDHFASQATIAKVNLIAAIEKAPQLFDKPKTITIDNAIKVGMRKQPGRIEIADEQAAMEYIAEFVLHPDDYIATTRKIRLTALNDLPGTDLKKMGATIIDAPDAPVAEVLDKTAEKLVNQYIKLGEK